jgi:large subunit ribosomal protein L9
MKVLLLKDVYKLGRAGDVKKVADGYGRNFLLPQGLAALAIPGMLKQTERIRGQAEKERNRLNIEMGSIAEQLNEVTLNFGVKAGETGKLYGSITSAMIVEGIEQETAAVIDRRQIEAQPIKTLGVHEVKVRLTIDLIPEITVVVHREGEPPESAYEIEEPLDIELEGAGQFADLQAELEAEDAEAEAAARAADETVQEDTEPAEMQAEATAEDAEAEVVAQAADETAQEDTEPAEVQAEATAEDAETDVVAQAADETAQEDTEPAEVQAEASVEPDEGESDEESQEEA